MEQVALRSATALLFALSLASCAGSPARLANASAEELSTQNDVALCNAYSINKSANVRDELVRRNAITFYDWNLIDTSQVEIGMSELALICMPGSGGTWGFVGETVTADGTARSWNHKSCQSCAMKRVITVNGKVASWHN